MEMLQSERPAVKPTESVLSSWAKVFREMEREFGGLDQASEALRQIRKLGPVEHKTKSKRHGSRTA
jgi:hypothetical protein